MSKIKTRDITFSFDERPTYCAQCFSSEFRFSETDEEDVFWTYCKPCDFWTEHGTHIEVTSAITGEIRILTIPTPD